MQYYYLMMSSMESSLHDCIFFLSVTCSITVVYGYFFLTRLPKNPDTTFPGPVKFYVKCGKYHKLYCTSWKFSIHFELPLLSKIGDPTGCMVDPTCRQLCVEFCVCSIVADCFYGYLASIIIGSMPRNYWRNGVLEMVHFEYCLLLQWGCWMMLSVCVH